MRRRHRNRKMAAVAGSFADQDDVPAGSVA